MRFPRGGGVRVPASLRTPARRFNLVVLLGLAAAFMIVDKAELDAARDLRAAVAAAAVPVMDALSRPVESVNGAVDEVIGIVNLRAENAELRLAVERLRHWETQARSLARENVALRRLSRLAPDRFPVFVTGRVVVDSGNAFVRAVLVNAGAAAGVREGHAAVTAEGLVGRVVDVGKRASRVLLLTDLNSRIPVVVERTGHHAVLAGDNTRSARLSYLPRAAGVAVGDRLVTSGQGAALPPGLPVGVVSEVSRGGARVRPIADLGRLEYVRLIVWTPPTLEPAPPAERPEQPASAALNVL